MNEKEAMHATPAITSRAQNSRFDYCDRCSEPECVRLRCLNLRLGLVCPDSGFVRPENEQIFLKEGNFPLAFGYKQCSSQSNILFLHPLGTLHISRSSLVRFRYEENIHLTFLNIICSSAKK